jgi:uncharacterized protein
MEIEPRQPVPVVPLPDVVLFPHARGPLHVLELRYRAMIRDALAGERLIALALLKPGWENDYHGSPEFHELACLAKVEQVRWRPDDCYDLQVHGVARVRLGATVREHPYRAARVTVLPEEPYTEGDPLVQSERRALMDCCRRLGRTMRDDLPFAALVNGLCMVVPVAAEERLELLALDSVVQRGHVACEVAIARLEQGRSGGVGENN